MGPGLGAHETKGGGCGSCKHQPLAAGLCKDRAWLCVDSDFSGWSEYKYQHSCCCSCVGLEWGFEVGGGRGNGEQRGRWMQIGTSSLVHFHSKLRSRLRACETHISPVNYSTDAEDNSSYWHLSHWLNSAALFWAREIRLESMNITGWTLGMVSLFLSAFPIFCVFSFLLPLVSFLLHHFLCLFFLASSIIRLLWVINCRLWKAAQQCRPFSWWLSKLSRWCLVETQPHQPHTQTMSADALCWKPEVERERGRGAGSVPENEQLLGDSWPDLYSRGTSTVTRLPFPPVK